MSRLLVMIRRATSFARRLLHTLAKPMKRDLGQGGIVVNPYRGYGSRDSVFLMGRVFRQARLGRMIPRRGMRRDLADVVRRIARRGEANVDVEVRFGEESTVVTTDRDGYFHAQLPLTGVRPKEGSWRQADLNVRARGEPPIRTTSDIFIPSAETDLLVISDIDDTVMYTGVAHRLGMLYRLFIEKPQRRTAFPGVASLYQALHRSADERSQRPILYVSRGPWAIYEVLETFFQLNRIPVGPILFLREWGLTLRHPWPRRAEDHKQAVITRILHLFDDTPCILMGDSGQHDPEVYARIVEAYPGRIEAIYIRRVDDKPDRERAIQALRDKIRHTRCELILAADSLLMAEHAHARGYISRHGLEAVRQDVVDPDATTH